MSESWDPSAEYLTSGTRAEVPPSSGHRAGILMRLVAAGLSADRQRDVALRAEDDRSLTVTGPGGSRCLLTTDDDGMVMAEAWPGTDGPADPAVIAAMIMRILDGDQENWHPDWPADSRLPLNSLVGRALSNSGLEVSMVVYEDPPNYEVFADVVVISPGRPEHGKIRLNDDGVLDWEWLSPPDASTAAIAERIVSVITTTLPADAGRE